MPLYMTTPPHKFLIHWYNLTVNLITPGHFQAPSDYLVTGAISGALTRAKLMEASATGRRFITLVPARQGIKPLIISDKT